MEPNGIKLELKPLTFLAQWNNWSLWWSSNPQLMAYATLPLL